MFSLWSFCWGQDLLGFSQIIHLRKDTCLSCALRLVLPTEVASASPSDSFALWGGARKSSQLFPLLHAHGVHVSPSNLNLTVTLKPSTVPLASLDTMSYLQCCGPYSNIILLPTCSDISLLKQHCSRPNFWPLTSLPLFLKLNLL